MIRENPIKKGLKEGKSYVGTFAKIADASAIEIMAMCGFDYIIIDGEHTHFNKETRLDLLRACDISGIVPIVRVRDASRSEILQALDAGGLGIMVPETGTKEEVEKVVYNTFYYPKGGRGFSTSHRAGGDTFMNGKEYAEKANEELMVVVYAETADALENIDEMLSVPNVDCLWIGPMDLTQVLGVIGDSKHPKVVETMNNIIEKCKKAGVAVGTIAATPADRSGRPAHCPELRPGDDRLCRQDLYEGTGQNRPRILSVLCLGALAITVPSGCFLPSSAHPVFGDARFFA
jgi:4-hydroxy-2-oxoheptanedioate aldolase